MSIKPKLKLCFGCKQDKVIWKQHEGFRYCVNCWNKIKPTVPAKRSALSKSQKPIAKQSPRRKKLDAAYSVLRKQYLQDHPVCEVNVSGLCLTKASQIHHSHSGGDREKYLNDCSTWFAICHECHEYVHNNGIWSKEMGYLK